MGDVIFEAKGVTGRRRHARFAAHWPPVCLFSAALAASAPCAWADSAASRNQAGNRLFEQGKYQDAEKAYLEAQSEAPDRPELTYNLGNSLVKQKKLDQGLKSLRQSIDKANTGLRANGWYNMGNTLFEMGKFQEAADAYVQSLKINPGDRDAKHNLELALQRLKQQEMKKESKNSDGKSQESKGGQSSSGQQKQEKPETNRQPGSEDQSEKDQRQQRQADQASRSDQSFTKEQALQILDALKNQELIDQRKLADRNARSKASGKDW
jgi:Ca-activated chloride channel family protein